MDGHNSPAMITLIDMYFIMPVMTLYLGWKCTQLSWCIILEIHFDVFEIGILLHLFVDGLLACPKVAHTFPRGINRYYLKNKV